MERGLGCCSWTWSRRLTQCVLFAVLTKFGMPPHLVSVIKRMNTDLQVSFDLNGEPVAVPCTVGIKQGCPLSPTLFLFVMQACLESLEKAMPADAKLKFQTNTRTEGKNGGHVSGVLEHRRVHLQLLGFVIR